MIRSMTGFGKAERLAPNKKFSVEIRSLNSKQLDLSIKMPSAYRSLEPEIRTLATKALQRGKVEIFVTAESTAVETSAHINKEQFRAYVRQLSDALTYAGMEASFDAMMQSVLRMPDVVSTPNETVPEEEHAALLAAAEEAVARLDDFRLQEGATLIADLLRRVDKIEGYKEEVVPYEKARTETIKARIRENLAQLDVEVDSNRLEQEMIFYLEKLDITEEKVRLQNHCRYFREVAADEETPGRKLGFIAQEMGREINTMGSKANQSNIQILVVKMKDELEKSKSRYSISYSEPSEAGLNIRPHGKTHHLFGSERFGQDNHRARAAPADSAAGILDLGHFARTARHGARRRGLLFPLARRIPSGGRRRAFRRMGGGLCRHLLRHAAQRTRPHLGERAYHSVRRRRAGRINLKRIFGADACSVFIMPPSIEELERRLELRGTDAPEVIAKRVAKAEFELTKAPEFDHVVVNDVLDTAVAEVERIVRDFLS